jgi:molybdate transport system ATP-binding protein
MIDIDVKIDLNTQNGKKEAHYKLHIHSNEFITLFGKSGAGKTTLLRLIAGLEKPKSGHIVVNGKSWFDSDKKINLPPQKRGVGFVFQDYALFPTMSVEKNLLYACKNSFHKANVAKLLKLVELENLSSAYPRQLSGGQKQRVALARALINEPKILLLDEPLSALDNEMRQKLQGELLVIHKEFKIPALLVSHDISETIKLSDKVAIIEDGKVERYDTPINIFRDDEKDVLFGEIIDIKKDKIFVMVGTSIVTVDSDEIFKYKVGEMMRLKLSMYR